MAQFGIATYRRGKLYFDNPGWAILKKVARITHKSPTYLVTQALKRHLKRKAK